MVAAQNRGPQGGPWDWGRAARLGVRQRCRLHPRLAKPHALLTAKPPASPYPQPVPTCQPGLQSPPAPTSSLTQTLDSQALALCPLAPQGHTWAVVGHQEKPSKGYSPTFFLTSDMTPMRVSTCCLERPSRGTPSAKVSAPSAPGSHRCRMKRDT